MPNETRSERVKFRAGTGVSGRPFGRLYLSAGILASNRIRPSLGAAHPRDVFATASEPTERIARGVRTGSMTFSNLSWKKLNL